MTDHRKDNKEKSDVQILSNYGVRPGAMHLAKTYLRAGYSHQVAALLAKKKLQ